MSELALTGGSANAVNPFTAFGAKRAQGNIVGKLLKFTKGDYYAGQDQDHVALGTRFIFNMDNILVGWQKWVDGRPDNQVLGLLTEAFQIPARHTLGDTDQDRWELDDDGKKKDPWQQTNKILLKDEVGDLYTFTTSSTGGLNAVADLCSEYGKTGFTSNANEYPVVAIGVGSFQHRDKKIGRVKYPKFEIVCWSPKVEFGGNTDDSGDVTERRQIADASGAAQQGQLTDGRPATTKF